MLTLFLNEQDARNSKYHKHDLEHHGQQVDGRDGHFIFIGNLVANGLQADPRHLIKHNGKAHVK